MFAIMRSKFLMSLHNKNRFLCLLIFVFYASYPFPHVVLSLTKAPETIRITIHFIIKERDYLTHDLIHFSVDHPSVSLSSWKANRNPVSMYDPFFKNNKSVFNQSCSIHLFATRDGLMTTPAYLYCTYYQKSEKKIKQIIAPLLFIQQTTENTTTIIPTKDSQITGVFLYASRDQAFFTNMYEHYITPYCAIIREQAQLFVTDCYNAIVLFFYRCFLNSS